MYSFKELRKSSKLVLKSDEIRFAILGNCSTQFLATAIQGHAKLSGINLNVFDADYNQIEAQLLNPVSELYDFNPLGILIWLSTDKLYEEFLDTPLNDRYRFADTYIQKIVNYWSYVAKNSKAKVFQMNFTEINDKVLGELSAKIDSTFIYQIRKLNWLLEEAMSSNNNVYPVDLLSIQIQVGQEVFYEAAYYYNAKISISTKTLPLVAKAINDILCSMLGKIKKCIVLDLDNTLWGGIIGDDGIGNIEIGELGRGHAFSNFQRWLKQLKEYGIILTVCSKNNESTAKEPFEKHEEMVLRLDDITLFVANWDDKASNIKLIQESLNIGMDSMVFIDDNPFERNLVRELIPEITVPEMPEDPALYLEYLQKGNYFDTVSFLNEGMDRTLLYKAEFERKQAEKTAGSIDDYLIALEMSAQAKAFEENRYSRIAQLTQRSNQFNLRTIRYTESDISTISKDNSYLTLYFTLKDKYGDHGLVGVVIMKSIDNSEVFIDTWLMSCRVLKRGMEEYVINKVVDLASTHGYSKISAEYIATSKNTMVKDIYPKMGFKTILDNKYVIEVKDYKIQKTYIQEED